MLSGPVKGKKLNSTSISENFVHVVEQEKNGIHSQANKLWDLDTLGIRPEDDVQENLLCNIAFTGERYSVSLPWKTGHGPIPLNYNASVARLKSQMSKLRKVPELLAEYNAKIAEQLEAGIISKAGDMKIAEKTSNLRHSNVII